MLLHHHGSLFVVRRLEAIIVFTLNAPHVHLHRLLVILGVLVAVRCLLVELLGLVTPVLLRVEEVAEEAAFENCVRFATQLRCFHDEINTCRLNHS